MFVLGMIDGAGRCRRGRQACVFVPVVVEEVAPVRLTMDGGRRAEITEEGHITVGIVGRAGSCIGRRGDYGFRTFEKARTINGRIVEVLQALSLMIPLQVSVDHGVHQRRVLVEVGIGDGIRMEKMYMGEISREIIVVFSERNIVDVVIARTRFDENGVGHGSG